MSKENLDGIRKALSEASPKSLAGKIRQIFDQIENAINNGVSRQEIVSILNNQGIECSFDTFCTTIYRIRKNRGKGRNKQIYNKKPITTNKIDKTEIDNSNSDNLIDEIMNDKTLNKLEKDAKLTDLLMNPKKQNFKF